MAYQKLQASTALEVIPSDTVEIPKPSSLMVSSTTTGAAANKLIDANAKFIVIGVKAGDIIYDTTTNIISKVTKVDSSGTELEVTTAIPNASDYTIYAQHNLPNNGCVLYIGSGGDVSLLTAGGSSVILKGLVTGQFVPVQTLRVNSTSTTATDIVALW